MTKAEVKVCREFTEGQPRAAPAPVMLAVQRLSVAWDRRSYGCMRSASRVAAEAEVRGGRLAPPVETPPRQKYGKLTDVGRCLGAHHVC